MSDTGLIVLTHPDLPGHKYETTEAHARVLTAAGWQPVEPKPSKPASKDADKDAGDEKKES